MFLGVLHKYFEHMELKREMRFAKTPRAGFHLLRYGEGLRFMTGVCQARYTYLKSAPVLYGIVSFSLFDLRQRRLYPCFRRQFVSRLHVFLRFWWTPQSRVLTFTMKFEQNSRMGGHGWAWVCFSVCLGGRGWGRYDLTSVCKLQQYEYGTSYKYLV